MSADPPAPPVAPPPEQCCRRFCERCIFDYYDDAFADWKAKVRALGASPDSILAALGQTQAKRPW